MREDLFDNALGCYNESCHGAYHSYTCNHCGMVNYLNNTHMQSSKSSRRLRRGNFFSQFTRKFSLGNGPPDWVQEYLITKEGGKMLGTLIALTVARMPNLESFVWDMPTGILRDVWIALSSLGDYKHGQQPRLDTLWIRLHDNREVIPTAGSLDPNGATQSVQASAAAASNSTSLGPNTVLGETPAPTGVEWSYRHVEHPNFSIISPLRRLCVLNIDEIAYLAELSILIESSLGRLRELRIGIASHVRVSGWASTQSGNIGNTLSNEDTTTQNLQSGGEFAVLVSKFFDCYADRNPTITSTDDVQAVVKPINADTTSEAMSVRSPTTAPKSALPLNEGPIVEGMVSHHLALLTAANTASLNAASVSLIQSDLSQVGIDQQDEIKDSVSMSSPQATPISPLPVDAKLQQAQQPSQAPVRAVVPESFAASKTRLLRLETLELERVLLDVAVLQRTIDWSIMTSLTLFQCDRHEGLWKALKRKYTPKPSFKSTRISTNRAPKCTPQHSPAREAQLHSSHDFMLNLRRIHTDQVSPSLISFLKETLAPNSLEWMFFQEEGGIFHSNISKYVSPVTLDAIYRGPIRRHRASLKKVLIDSGVGNSESRVRNEKWRKWMFSRELLTFITSGKMSNLKEIAMAIDYKDWVQCRMLTKTSVAVANNICSISSSRDSLRYRIYARCTCLT